MIAETLELTDMMGERFGQDRIFFTGQSLGSALDFMTIAKDRPRFLSFVPTSERVDRDRSMFMEYE